MFSMNVKNREVDFCCKGTIPELCIDIGWGVLQSIKAITQDNPIEYQLMMKTIVKTLIKYQNSPDEYLKTNTKPGV